MGVRFSDFVKHSITSRPLKNSYVMTSEYARFVRDPHNTSNGKNLDRNKALLRLFEALLAQRNSSLAHPRLFEDLQCWLVYLDVLASPRICRPLRDHSFSCPTG